MKSLTFQVSFVLILLFHFGQSAIDIKAIQAMMKTESKIKEDVTGDENCDVSKAAACDALCMIYVPYYTYGPFRSGCLDGNEACWCCDPSFDSSGNVVICPADDKTDCNSGCHQLVVTDVSACSHAGFPGFPGGYGGFPGVGIPGGGYGGY